MILFIYLFICFFIIYLMMLPLDCVPSNGTMVREKIDLKIGLNGGAMWACSWWMYVIPRKISQ